MANLTDKQADEYGNDSDDESGSDAEAEDTDSPSDEEDWLRYFQAPRVLYINTYSYQTKQGSSMEL